jgi:hypothetical protein
MRMESTDGNPIRSVDEIRLIRRSLRCFYFGCFGLVPIIGLGLGLQSLRQAGQIFRELEQPWRRPAVYVYWLIGLGLLWAYGWLYGVTGIFFIFWLFVAIPAWHLWRSFPDASRIWSNPAERQVRFGVILSYTGCFLALVAIEGLLTALLYDSNQ